MFSPRVIDDKLRAFRNRFGWLPVRHSIAEIDKASDFIQSKLQTNADGALVFDDKNWTPKLVRFVQNEQAMATIDCAYFLTRYYKISAENRFMRFQFRSGQKVFYKVCQDLEERGVSIEIQCLKARKQGISTLVEGIMTHSGLFIPGAKCSVGSANDQKTYVMMGMMYDALEHMPWWIKPEQTKDKRSGAAILEFAKIGTSIIIQSGSMKGGIGQGTTPTRIHLSECCDFTDPVVQIEEGLFKAVPSTPDIFMVLESTGNGNTGWWANQWRTNKENYWQGKARLLPLFLPWFMTPELFPTEHWMKKFPFPKNWRPVPETLAMKAKCEAYAHNTKILHDVLGDSWTLPLEQQWYWEYHFLDARQRRTEKSWTRQMPCDDFEALIGENDNVFDWDSINNIERRRSRTMEAFGILGEGIAERHEPTPASIGPGSRYVSRWTTPREEKLEWVFLPLRSDDIEQPTFDPLKKLIIYQYPEKNCDYSIGVDTGTGVGGDRSVISVARTGRKADSDVQVAEFTSDDITNVEIYAWVAAIAAFYGQYMDEGRTPKIIIEQRRKYGDTCQHQLKLMGMNRHHEFVEYDKKTLKPKSNINGRQGWFTNAWSRPMLLGMFKYAVENGWYEVNSRWLLAEMEAQEQVMTVSGKTRMDHVTGKHDDRIFAAAMSYFCLHDLDVMIERAKLKYNAPEEEGYVVDYSAFQYTIPNKGAEEFMAQFAEVK
jgi:hypothetical protein